MTALQITQCSILVYMILGLIALIPLVLLFEFRQWRISELIAVQWEGYVDDCPAHGILVEYRRYTFAGKETQQRYEILVSLRCGAGRLLCNSTKVPYWLEDQVLRRARTHSIRHLSCVDTRLRLRASAIKCQQDQRD
jgi:hypothetical protein